MQVQTGVGDIVLAGGAESMSQVEFYSTEPALGSRAASRSSSTTGWPGPAVTAGGENHPVPGGMLETAENLRASTASRARSRTSTRCAHTSAPSPPSRPAGSPTRSSRSRCDRAGRGRRRPRRAPARRHHAGALAGCAPCWRARTPRRRSPPATPAARTTARRSASSPPGDSADELGSAAAGRLVSWAVAGVPPGAMGIGPVPAVRSALEPGGT